MRKVTLNIHVYFEWTAERYVGSDLTKWKIQVAAPDDVTFKVNLTCGNRLLYQSLLNVKVFTRFHERLDFFSFSEYIKQTKDKIQSITFKSLSCSKEAELNWTCLSLIKKMKRWNQMHKSNYALSVENMCKYSFIIREALEIYTYNSNSAVRHQS